MKLALPILRRFTSALPDTHVRALLDDLGLEVKRTDDELYTLELLANRGDHRSYAGVAREVHARLGGSLSSPEIATLDIGDGPAVRVESALCLRYTLTPMTRSGDERQVGAQDVLDAAGIHSVSPAVDATNIANLELGQPTHAFDADTIVGTVVVREARAGEMCWPLFQENEVAVPEGALVIADDEKILAVAGVIGCEESKTTDATTTLWVESATFDPVAVRKASRAMGINTDSSARFERGADPLGPEIGAGRVVQLLEDTGVWKRSGATSSAGGWTDPQRTIRLSPAAASAFIGLTMCADEITTLLTRYGFTVRPVGDALDVRVPPVRLWEVEDVADLYEELAKGVGYNLVPTSLPPVDSGAVPTELEQRRRQVTEVLLGQGFSEVISDGFYGKELLELGDIEPGHPLYAHIETQNALDRGYGYLKNNCLLQAAQAIATNMRVKNPAIRGYEWTRTFHPNGEGDLDGRTSPCDERHMLWAIASGPVGPAWWGDARPEPVNAWFMKGLAQEISAVLGLELRFANPDPGHALYSLLHPHRHLQVLAGDTPIGVIGELHPKLGAKLKLKKIRPVYLELDATALLSSHTQTHPYVTPSARPPMERQLTFDVPGKLQAQAIEATVRSHAPDWLESLTVLDVYDNDGVRAITWNLQYTAAQDRTADQVNEVTESLISAVTDAHPGVGIRT